MSGYIERDSLAVMYGPPGKGKSFIVLDLACCIATATPFHGHAVKPGAVSYIAGEGHNGIARRLRAWSQYNDMPLTHAPLFVSDGATDLSSPSDSAAVINAVKALAGSTGRHPSLIVIDTLARNFGGNENDATDIGQFIRNVDHLRHQWKATVMIVHHSGKDGDRGARGSSALKGAADAEYEVGRGDEDKLVRLTPRKMKDADEPAPLAFDLIPVSVRDDTGLSVSGAVLRLAECVPAPSPIKDGIGKNQMKALEILKAMHDEYAARLQAQGREDAAVRIELTEWKARCEQGGIARNRFMEVREKLVMRGLVIVNGVHALITHEAG